MQADSRLFKAVDIAHLSRYCFWLVIFSVTLFSCQSKEEVQLEQYKVRGESLYEIHCSNCHQKDGRGLGRVYPPLNKSDFMENNFEATLCLMRYGKTGEVIVNGISFNQGMKGVPYLTDLEVAEIATYIYNQWGRERGIVHVHQVQPILDSCRMVVEQNR